MNEKLTDGSSQGRRQGAAALARVCGRDFPAYQSAVGRLLFRWADARTSPRPPFGTIGGGPWGCQVYRLPGVGPDVRFFIGFSGLLSVGSSPLEKGRFPGTSRFDSASGGPARESSMTQHETFLDLLALIL